MKRFAAWLMALCLASPAYAQLPPPITPPATGNEVITCYQNNVPYTCTSSQISSVGVTTAQSANKVYAGPTSGSPAAPTFRNVVPADATGSTSGSGNFALTTSPVFTTPNLGTPSAATLTNAIGLPVSTGISGLGTGVATALAINVGTAGAFVINGGALGTPASGTATNLTGTASGLTAGNVTTNANLTGPITSTGNATAIAAQTGTGTTFVMSVSPTLVTPNLGTPSAGIATNLTGLPLTTGVTGTLPVANGGTGVTTGAANQFFGTPNGSIGAPALRALVTTDIPTIAATKSTFTASGAGGITETVQASLQRLNYADQWGADNTCTSDASIAIANAFAATSGVIHLSGCYRASSTVIVPTGRVLNGDTISFSNPVPTQTTRIVCDLTVTPCVQVGSGGSNGSTSLRSITVTRAAGTPGAAVVGVQVLDGQVSSLVDVQSVSHGICYQALAHPSTGVGITLNADRIYSGACVTTHMDISSFPEVRISHSRFGQNGAGDYAATSFVRIEGGIGGTAGGPNTITFTSDQFTQGVNSPSYFMEFINLGAAGVPSIDAVEFNVMDSHIEGVATALFHSDSTWNKIDRVVIANNTFNTPSSKVFALNAATSLNEWSLTNNIIYATDLTLAPTGAIDQFYWAGGKLSGTTSITGTSSSTVSVVGVSHGGNVTYTGPFSQLSSIGEMFTAGSMDATAASGGINILSPNSRAVIGTGGVPTVSVCGTTPAIDGRSTDNGGVVITGSGTVTACTVTYAQAFPTMAWPTITLNTSSAVSYYISASSKTGFTVSFSASLPSQAFIYNVTGK